MAEYVINLSESETLSANKDSDTSRQENYPSFTGIINNIFGILFFIMLSEWEVFPTTALILC